MPKAIECLGLDGALAGQRCPIFGRRVDRAKRDGAFSTMCHGVARQRAQSRRMEHLVVASQGLALCPKRERGQRARRPAFTAAQPARLRLEPCLRPRALGARPDAAPSRQDRSGDRTGGGSPSRSATLATLRRPPRTGKTRVQRPAGLSMRRTNPKPNKPGKRSAASRIAHADHGVQELQPWRPDHGSTRSAERARASSGGTDEGLRKPGSGLGLA